MQNIAVIANNYRQFESEFRHRDGKYNVTCRFYQDLEGNRYWFIGSLIGARSHEFDDMLIIGDMHRSLDKLLTIVNQRLKS